MKKYKKDGSFTVRWLQHDEYMRQFEESRKLEEEENEWYYNNGILPPSAWLNLDWRQKEKNIEKQKREKLSSELTTCVYCNRLIRPSRQAYIKRWDGKDRCFIGSDANQRKLEYGFQWNRICFGCANTEFAIGKATAACETALTELKREIHAKTHGNFKKHSRSAPALAGEPG
jgi:hypothetical protein